MGLLDIAVFVGFVVLVVGVGLGMSRESDDSTDAQDYFLAGRGLTWWLIGFSLIAANISTEQFVGMSGQAADWLGLAIASYEWMAAVALIAVAFIFLPTFLKSGIYTIPEFLEYRYNRFARLAMAIISLVILVGVPTASVIYSGAKVITVGFKGQTLMGLDLGDITTACWIIAVLAAVYVFTGGLKACAWADLIQGAALIVGGGVVAYLAMQALSAADPEQLAATAASSVTAEELAGKDSLGRLLALNQAPLPDGKLHMVRPKTDPAIPWTALIAGLWIPNFFYWGLNQYITQRTLGSKSLAEGQKGIVFAAFMKLILPFVIVIPGILAWNLFRDDLAIDAKLLQSKNAQVLKQFADGDKKTFFAFDERFAELQPDTATKMLASNAKALGVEPPVAISPREANQANRELAAKNDANARQLPTARVVSYDFDAAFPTLLRKLLPVGNGLKGFVYAAIFGAVVSSLASMLNSAATIATMDLYRAVRTTAPQEELVGAGRAFTVLFTLIAVLIAPSLSNPAFGGIFTFIQEFQGFISPGVLAIFLFGLLVHRAPRVVGVVGLLLNPVLYGVLKVAAPQVTFLDRMAICFAVVVAVLTAITLVAPLKEPVTLPVNEAMDITPSRSAQLAGIGVLILTAALYVVFY
jgi:SSS family solute:Na+ symporter